ncbi:hypothetical protein POHY109586_21425 [Polaromonas hydrogenivorans]
MKTWVFTSKAAYMQRIQDYVRTGHSVFIQGVIATAKVPAFAEKMTGLHPVFDNKLKAFRAREKGEATGRLMFWLPQLESENAHWILLIHPARDDPANPQKAKLDPSEKWKNAAFRDEKIELTGYELVRQTKENAPKPVWTWRYRADRYDDLRDALVLAIRSKRDQDVKRSLETIWGTMGFAGSRGQAKALEKIFKDEWKRRRPGEILPQTPAGHGYLRRKADIGVFLGGLEKKVSATPGRKLISRKIKPVKEINLPLTNH